MRDHNQHCGHRAELEDRLRAFVEGHFGGRGHHHGHGHHGWRRHEEGGEGRGRFGGGGPWRARRGEARHILLSVLADGPKHGYEIIKTIEERTGGEWAPSAGTVYPTLQYLEEAGLIQAVQDGERKAYTLTDKGKEDLESRAEELEAFWGRFDTSAQAGGAEMGYIRDEIETLMKTLRRGLHQPGKKVEQETLRQIRAVIEGAREEVRKLLSEEPKA